MSEWRETTWGAVVTLQRGYDITKNSQNLCGSVPVVSSGGVSSRHDVSISDGPGVVIGRKGTLGRVHYVDGPFWPHDTTLWVKDFKGNHPRFVSYALTSIDPADFNVGSASPTLNRNHVHPLPVWWPSTFAEQQAIAEVLGALDDKIAANERVRSRAWSLARVSFARDRVLAEPAEHLSLGQLSARGWLSLSDGYRTKASEHGRPGLRILRAGDVRPDRIDPRGEDFVSVGHAEAIGAKVSMAHDVVVTTKGTVGRVAVVSEGQEQVVYSPQLCFFRVADEEKLASGFLAGWFRSSDFAAQAEMRMYKSDMAPYINLKDIQSMVVPVPVEMDEQRRIDHTQRSLERLAHSADRENEQLAATRDELLPLLMSGKLRVKDTEKVVEEVL